MISLITDQTICSFTTKSMPSLIKMLSSTWLSQGSMVTELLLNHCSSFFSGNLQMQQFGFYLNEENCGHTDITAILPKSYLPSLNNLLEQNCTLIDLKSISKLGKFRSFQILCKWHIIKICLF